MAFLTSFLFLNVASTYRAISLLYCCICWPDLHRCSHVHDHSTNWACPQTGLIFSVYVVNVATLVMLCLCPAFVIMIPKLTGKNCF